MILKLTNHNYVYSIEKLCRIFFPDEQMTAVSDSDCVPDGNYIETEVKTSDNSTVLSARADIDGKYSALSDNICTSCDIEKSLEVLLFHLLSEMTGYCPPWGILTGVRPSKLMNSLIEKLGNDGAKKNFSEKLLVSEKKTELAFIVAECEQRIMKLSDAESFSLYISIPYCPSRCKYCSFVSHSITGENAKKTVPQYVELLTEEIRINGQIARELGLKLESVYFGGGTPTVLTASQLDIICKAVQNNFDLSSCREYTVEAGRPDTITREKLDVLKNYGVTRISVNPQTLNDDVLELIGRKHSSADMLTAFALARSCGFDNINTDLIAGLSGDTLQSFSDSLTGIISLSPESITVHTLALKRSSSLVTDEKAEASGGEAVEAMLDFAQKELTDAGYIPYYMYRQSHSVGNFENVGWCKPSHECLYNIYMMEECHSILACGAGAVTKLKAPHENYIERIFNFKYPYEYIGRFDELTERKSRIKEFYASYY